MTHDFTINVLLASLDPGRQRKYKYLKDCTRNPRLKEGKKMGQIKGKVESSNPPPQHLPF